MTAVYVSCADSGSIDVLRLDTARGVLTPRQQLDVGGVVMPLALSPDHRFLYAARRSAPLAVASFSIDAASGDLTPLGEAPLPHSMASIATDRSGRFLLSASYGGDQIAVSPIGADGVARAAQQVLATPPKAHAILADATNRFVYSTSLGGGVLLQWRFDAATGALTPNAPPALRPHPGASPRHLVFGHDGRFVYLLNEFDATIDVLCVDAANGTLARLHTVGTVPAGFTGEPWAADLHLTPDGRFLYSSERRTSTLAAFGVDAVRGGLTPLGHTPTETQPRGFNITACGRWLIAAGQESHRLGVYAIDAVSGALTWVSACAVGQNPNWVETVALK